MITELNYEKIMESLNKETLTTIIFLLEATTECRYNQGKLLNGCFAEVFVESSLFNRFPAQANQT